VQLKTAKAAGQMDAKFILDLAGYVDEPVSVRLDDGDSTPIAVRQLGALSPVGAGVPVRQWRFKSKARGLQDLQLKRRKTPGEYQLHVKAKRWFTAAQANQPAASTTLTVSIGTECFSRVVTKKTD
jgi:hypothetical protein